MKCQILFSGKNKKNISKCRLLKILPRVLSVKRWCVLYMPIFHVFEWKSMISIFILLINIKRVSSV